MTLNQIRTYTQQVITALHAAGWDADGFGLGNDLRSIGYQPSMPAAYIVLECAERLAECLEANDHPAPAPVR